MARAARPTGTAVRASTHRGRDLACGTRCRSCPLQVDDALLTEQTEKIGTRETVVKKIQRRRLLEEGGEEVNGVVDSDRLGSIPFAKRTRGARRSRWCHRQISGQLERRCRRAALGRTWALAGMRRGGDLSSRRFQPAESTSQCQRRRK